MSDASDGADHDAGHESDERLYPDVPNWDDEYVDRVSDRLMFSYDLEKDVRASGETFVLGGTLRMESHKQFLHRSIKYGHHRAMEHLFLRRSANPTVAELERVVSLGHDLADERIDADEEHYGTEFIFTLVADEIPDDVHEFVSGFRDRNLLKYGLYGQYEIHLAVVAPEVEELVSSKNCPIDDALRLWEPLNDDTGLLGRLLNTFRR
jgi:hypothetical protein